MLGRDPAATALVLLGLAAGAGRLWLARLLPDYAERPWWWRGLVRLGLLAGSAALAWWLISWRTSGAGHHADPGAYWALWGIGLAGGFAMQEVSGAVDRMMP